MTARADDLRAARAERDARRDASATAALKEKYMHGKTPLASNVGNALLALQTEPN
jgi:hypothetical protein